jgi:hypothetical protein
MRSDLRLAVRPDVYPSGSRTSVSGALGGPASRSLVEKKVDGIRSALAKVRSRVHLREGGKMLRKFLVATTMACVLLFGVVGMALADSTGTPGQPSQSCGSEPSAPGGGNSSQSPGSPFATVPGKSAGVYANPGTTPGGGPNAGNSNPHAVAQYDVACFQVSQPHP